MPAPLTMGELITLLKNCQNNEEIYFNFPGQFPTTFDSYRGYYDEIALGHGHYEYPHPITRDILIQRIEEAMGPVFTGWKGGEFVYDANTPVWVANPGQCEGYAITRVIDKGYKIILFTENCEGY